MRRQTCGVGSSIVPHSRHYPAWWELYLFTLFSRLGYAVEVHPDTGTRRTRPDFRCTHDGFGFYLEATTVFSGIVEDGRHAEREGWILDLVNEARNPNFFVHLAFRAVGSQRPKRVEVVPPIEKWLATLDPTPLNRSCERTRTRSSWWSAIGSSS